jgi:hypothetical protein
MDINNEAVYPASELSNFEAYEFVIDDIACNSMEGFLQSLKYEDQKKQWEICLLVGKKAKFAGKKKKWYLTQKLYWKGVMLNRHGIDYQNLLDRAFASLAKNERFKIVLLATADQEITHSMGKQDPQRTILTEQEFCSRLLNLRQTMHGKKN